MRIPDFGLPTEDLRPTARAAQAGPAEGTRPRRAIAAVGRLAGLLLLATLLGAQGVHAQTDTTPPTLVGGEAFGGRAILLTFSEDLDTTAASRPPTSAFEVTVNGVPQVVDNIYFSTNTQLALEFEGDRNLSIGETVVVTYTDPSAGNDSTAIQDLAGNDVASFTTGEDGTPGIVNQSDQVTEPFPPTGLTATAGETTIDLAWTPPARYGGSAITKHQYREKEGSGTYGSWTDIPSSAAGEANANSYTVTGLTLGTTYTYEVRAVNAEGESAASGEASATTVVDTTPPTLVEAFAPGSDRVTLGFSEDLDRDALQTLGNSAFEVTANGVTVSVLSKAVHSVQRRFLFIEMIGNPFRLGDTIVVTYTDPSADNDSTAIQDEAGNDAASFTTGQGGNPGVVNNSTTVTEPFPPTNLTATAAGETAIDLAWEAPARDGGSAVTGYRIERSDDDGSSWTDVEEDTDTTATTYRDTGLASGATYRYRVSAINSQGTGEPSGTAEATTVDTTPPTLVEAFAPGSDRVTLGFSEDLDRDALQTLGNSAFEVTANGVTVSVLSKAVHSVQRRFLFIEMIGNPFRLGDTIVVTYTDPSADNDSTAIQDEAGNDAASFTTGQGGNPGVVNNSTTVTEPFPPTNLTATAAGETAIDLAWEAPARNGGSAITKYQYREKEGSGTYGGWTDIPNSAAGEANAVSYTVTGLTLGTTYTYEVRAVNVVGGSDASNEASATLVVPTEPTNLNALGRERSVAIWWATPDEDGGRPITKYQYREKEGSGAYGGWTDIPGSAPGGANANSYTVSGRTAGTTYTYQVRAVNAVGGSDPSNEASATPTAMATPLETGAFVSNVNQSDHGNIAEAGRDQTWAQGFRTGSTFGGYELTSIELDVGGTLPRSSDLTVSLRAEGSRGYPANDDLVTFVNPDLSGAGRKKWTLPTDMPFYRLSRNTTYFVVVTSADDTFEWRVTGSKNEDSGATPQWQILDAAYASDPTVNPPVWGTDNDFPVLQIRINGDVPSTDGTLANLELSSGGERVMLVPNFSPTVFKYVIGVPNRIFMLTVTPTLRDGQTLLPYTGLGRGTILTDLVPETPELDITLDEGRTDIVMEVASEEGGIEGSYQITIIRDRGTATSGLLRPGFLATNLLHFPGSRIGGTEAFFSAQAFTTGSHANGYDLTDIVLCQGGVRNDPDDHWPDVELWSAGEDGAPGSFIAQLKSVSGLPQAWGTNHYMPEREVVLAANTTYFMVVKSGANFPRRGVRLLTSDSDGEDTNGTAPNWSIADHRHSKTRNGTAWTTDTGVLGISVRGTPNTEGQSAPGEPPTATVVSSPERHDGENRFSVRIDFSEPLEVHATTLRDHAFKAARGDVTAARQVESGDRSKWEIEVEPAGADSVTLTLAPSPECRDSHSLCTSDGRRLEQGLELTVPGPPQLTARIEDVPSEHDGSKFEVIVSFSEPIQNSDTLVHKAASATTGGTVTSSLRYGDRSDIWRFLVAPDGNGPVTFILTGGGACAGSESAVLCAEDGTVLSNDVSATVLGPAAISVAGAEAAEGAGTMEFTVSLSRPALGPVTVDYATSDSTATAGEDYKAASGTLTFSIEQQTKTVAVKILDDGNPEEEKMFTLTLSNAANGYIKDGTATGTIRDDDADAVPLTASFEDMPPIHTGDSFRFKLIFSEELNVSYKTLEDDAFDVTGGELNGASRLNEGSNRRWRITIKPDSESDTVTITLPETTNCRADGAICTRDKRPLSNSLSATVAAVDESVPVVSVADAFASEGDTVAFTVSLSKASDQQVTVAYATSDGTATAGDDFTAASGTLAFAANETSKTVGVATAADSDAEENETFTLTLSSPANAALGDAAATGTISDDADAAPLTASFVDMPADHGMGAFAFKLIFSAKPEVTYKMLEDDAFDVTGGEVRAASRLKQGSDLGWEIRIQPDSKFSTVTVTLPETTDCDAVEAICTKDGRPLSNSPSATVIGQEGHWGASRLDVSDASAAEGDAVEFTVSLTRMSNHEVTVSYATSGGTATAGDDFTAASGTLAFTTNETSKTVSVATTDDSDDEEDETFTLTLSSPAYTTLGDSTATGTIEDDDDAAPLTASFADMPSTHTGDSFTFGLVFSEEPDDVSYQTLRDDAFDVTGGSVTGASRQEQGSDLRWTITVEPASANSAVTVTLPETTDCNADGAICTEDGRPLSNSPSATVEGADEATSVPAVSVTDASATEGNSVAFTVSLSEASDEQVTVDYATSGGTAASGTDFTEASGTLAFGASETSKTVSVATTDDSDDEEDETFTLTLSSPVNATLGDAAATGTIEDDDDAPPLTATLKNAPPEHDGSKFEIVISFSEEIQNSYTHVHQAASATTGGTLTSSARHQGRKDMWKFRVQPDGNGPVTFILSGGGTCAGSKSAVLCTRDGRVLSNAVSATVSGPAAISVADAEATEGTDAAASFTVSLSRPAIGPVTVDYATGDGTATAGEDYTAASGTLTFSIREQTKTVSVPVLDDAGAEDGETFTLTLSNASNGYIEDGTATGTIHDDDDEAASVPAVSVADASATEGDPVAFTVSLSAASDEQVTVAYATSGGTAASGTDFTASSGTLAFGANETSKTVSVETTDDSDDEEDETFTLTLSSPANATLGDAAATGTIEDDDDAPPPLTARFANMSSSHTGDPFTFGLVFSEEPDDLSYRTLRDDAFDVTGGSVAGASRQEQGSDRRWTITVEPASATSTMTITLPETTNCNADGAICTEDDRPLSNSPSATVEGEDEVVPVVSVADASAAEGDPVAFTVSLSAASDEQVTVAYATSGGTAAAGDDFTASSGTLAFGANETSKTVSVATIEDSDDEEDETFTLTLSSPSNATLGAATATGTIEDDDDAPPPLTATFADMPSTHTGDSFTFALVFSEEFRISYKTLRDDAFEVTGGSVTGAGRQEQGSNRRWTITVEPASANDTVTVTLPETTDCNADGAICTDDDRPLSHSLSATVIDAASASSTAGDAAGGVVEDDGLNDALAVLAGLTPDEARAALLGEETLSEARLAALDRLGNRNGRYDLGDMLSWIERCRRGEADCGTTSSDPVPPASAALLAVAAAGPGRRRRKRPRRRRRQARMAGRALALLMAATAWSCTGDLVGPPAGDPAARTGNVAGPPAALSGPGLLTVEWTAPPGRRAIGVLLELEGPGIDAIAGADGLELHHSAAHGRHRIVVAGPLESGPLLRFRVPDRGQLARYRVRVLQVTGEDYGLVDAGEYRAAAAPN